MKEFATTVGTLQWDRSAFSVDYADDPVPPDGEGWVMCGSATGELRNSQQPILWFWCRDRKST